MPTISELQDVLDWQAIAVVRAVDERDGAPVAALVDDTGLDRDVVENRLQQVTTLGLGTAVDADDGTVYELTGQGHAAVGSGLYEGYELVGEATVDDLATQVAGLLDRRDEIRADLADLRADAAELREKARRQFGDREDVGEAFESLMDDLDALAAAVDEEGGDEPGA